MNEPTEQVNKPVIRTPKRLNAYMGFDVKKALDSVLTEYERVCEQNRRLMKTVEDFRKEDEIREAREHVEEIQKRSLHLLSTQELIDYRDFRQTHYNSCKNASEYIIMLSGTGLGEAITVKCPVCGMSRDITDISSW